MSTFSGTRNGVQASGNSVNNIGSNNSGTGSGSQNYGPGSGSNHVRGGMSNNQGYKNIQSNNNNNSQKGEGNKNVNISGSVTGGSANSSGVTLGYSTQKAGDINI